VGVVGPDLRLPAAFSAPVAVIHTAAPQISEHPAAEAIGAMGYGEPGSAARPAPACRTSTNRSEPVGPIAHTTEGRVARTGTKTSLEIAQEAVLRPIGDVAAELGLKDEEVDPYGRYKAKVDLGVIDRLADRPDAKLICVTAVTPTAAGEGKTTTSVSLTQGLGTLGQTAALAIREASLGPVFGVKGGAAGAGHAQIVPMEDLNLHFTGDIHAISAANNLLAAFIDAHILHGNELRIDPHTISWRRALDMNDRGLRSVITGLGGAKNGTPRETGFDITAASEVMAILALAVDLPDLRRRLGAITIGENVDGEPVTAEQIGCAGSMAVLLKDAIRPNLVQTLEGQPAFVHCGPFANIAHGNSSVVADRVALKTADYLITESGFGADMGFEKFVDIVCRQSGIRPAAVVLVVTVKALQLHGESSGETEKMAAITKGAENMVRHLGIVEGVGLPCVVAVNRFPQDTDDEVELVKRLALEAGARDAEINTAVAEGGAGAADLARAVMAAADQPSELRMTYADDAPLDEKIRLVAQKVYGARDIDFLPAAKATLKRFTDLGYDRLPVCMAKSHLSLSHDPNLKNAPTDFVVPIRDLRAYTGAGFVTVLCGDVMQMPGLGKNAAGLGIDIDESGRTIGLF
jgi:formate--tetrahydrofolate ligase